jgi:hypothetical protein
MIQRMIRIAVAGALMLTVAGTTNAFAKAGDVVRTGACSGSSDWKLKLSPQDGKIEVEYEVDSNKVGQTWRVRLFENGTRIFAGNRMTKAPSGSFTVRVLATNHAGSDAFTARAANLGSGEICGGKASIG